MFMKRHWITTLAVALAVFAGATGIAAQQTSTGAGARQPAPGRPKAKAAVDATPIRDEIDFEASPQRVYEALLDQKQFSEFTGMVAEIDRNVGGAFTLFEASFEGLNVELIPNRKIVQSWRASDWPAGLHSRVTFELQPRGTGTHLVFSQTGYPAGSRDELAPGWEENYWTPLKEYLKQ